MKTFPMLKAVSIAQLVFELSLMVLLTIVAIKLLLFAAGAGGLLHGIGDIRDIIAWRPAAMPDRQTLVAVALQFGGAVLSLICLAVACVILFTVAEGVWSLVKRVALFRSTNAHG